MQTYEKLGAFYLGRLHDLAAGRTTDQTLLYDAKDLTTHAVCVGMTGSGKTGLCVSLLEEAGIDGIPSIVIDPKGDMGNLLLTFPRLRPQDFRPWIDESEARRKGMTPEEYAADRAKLWADGLGSWDQDGQRIARFRDAVDLTIYTPGSNAGRPLTVLRSFNAPGPEITEDSDAMRERVASATSGLLALLGIDADPIRSREHIFLSTILDRAWREGRDLDLADLIAAIQSPPFDRIGVMDLEMFFPGKDRMTLAMSLNSLLASPGFAGWMEGEPLDVGRLLYTESGRPRISILSIAHLSESERMFFVTILLNEVVTWMRGQSGTSSLRAILYMDEVFGFFPPTANPPAKTPMLTLLKQARAYGLGVVLATQNPVDLDYKGLSNAGTWFLGRLQTERDKRRVMEGLEGASVAAGADFDRGAMEATLAGLGSRVFLMNNVHDDRPAIFHTRWAMSYLRGPLTRGQIRTLTATGTAEQPAKQTKPAASVPSRAVAAAAIQDELAAPPAMPAGVKRGYLPITRSIPADERLVYRPTLLGVGEMHFVRTAAKVDAWRKIALLASIDEDTLASPWEEGVELEGDTPKLDRKPDGRGVFEPPPTAVGRPKRYAGWSKKFVDHLYRHEAITIRHSRSLKAWSRIDEDERAFRIRLRELLRDKRDLAVEKLRKRYTPKVARLEERIRKAEQRVDVEKTQYQQQGLSTAVSLGASIVGALFGRKSRSIGTTVRGAGRTAQQRSDVGRAKENVAALQQQLDALEQEFEDELEATSDIVDVDNLDVTEVVVRPRKSDMRVKGVSLAWAPYRVAEDGRAQPAFGSRSQASPA